MPGWVGICYTHAAGLGSPMEDECCYSLNLVLLGPHSRPELPTELAAEPALGPVGPHQTNADVWGDPIT